MGFGDKEDITKRNLDGRIRGPAISAHNFLDI